MGVYACQGVFGSGKTAFACWFSRYLAEVRGCPVWANFDLLGSTPIYTFDDLYDCVGGVICLDELQGTIHARRSNSNLEFLRWFDQCRKQDSDVICITQALHKIDVIVREMIEMCFDCEKAGGTLSKITPIDLVKGRGKSPVIFDRRQSFGFYDHRQRAWALKKTKEEALEEIARTVREPASKVVPAPAVEWGKSGTQKREKGSKPWQS